MEEKTKRGKNENKKRESISYNASQQLSIILLLDIILPALYADL